MSHGSRTAPISQPLVNGSVFLWEWRHARLPGMILLPPSRLRRSRALLVHLLRTRTSRNLGTPCRSPTVGRRLGQVPRLPQVFEPRNSAFVSSTGPTHLEALPRGESGGSQQPAENGIPARLPDYAPRRLCSDVFRGRRSGRVREARSDLEDVLRDRRMPKAGFAR